MSKRVLGYSGTAHWSHETDSCLATFDVPFTVGDFWPAQTYGDPDSCHPAEGGEIELGGLRLTEYIEYSPDGDPERTLADLTAEDRVKLEREYDALIERDWKTREKVYEECYATKVED